MLRGLMTEQEWEIIELFPTSPSSHGGRPTRNHRRVLDGSFGSVAQENRGVTFQRLGFQGLEWLGTQPDEASGTVAAG